MAEIERNEFKGAGGGRQVLTLLPPQKWDLFTEFSGVLGPGCFFVSLHVSGHDEIRGILSADQALQVLFIQIPLGPLTPLGADLHQFNVPAGGSCKFRYRIKHPFVSFAFNPTAQLTLRAGIWLIPVVPPSVTGGNYGAIHT